MEEEFDLDVAEASNLDRFYAGKDCISKWNKKKLRQNVRSSSHNTLSKLHENVSEAKIVSSSANDW